MFREGSVAPKERVNIVYRSLVGGVEQDIELPFKILVLGDFSLGNDDAVVEELRPLMVEKSNFDTVLNSFNLQLEITTPDSFSLDAEDRLKLAISIQKLKDFEPDSLVHRVPRLRNALNQKTNILRLRTLLQETPQLSEAITGLLADQDAKKELSNELSLWKKGESQPDGFSRMEDLFALAGSHCRDEFEYIHEGLLALLEILLPMDAPPERIDRQFLDLMAADLDWKLGRQLDEILHHPEFQNLERAWRGLKYLVDHVDFKENIQLEILDLPKDKLLEDFTDALDILQSGFYQLVYSREYGQFGGTPYGVIIADYQLGPSPRDIKLLTDMAATATMAHAPVIANAAPDFFGSNNFLTLPNFKDPAGHFSGRQFARWQTLRESEDARCLGLALPRFLLRKPYTAEDMNASGLAYEETVRGNHEHLLWGGAALAFGSRLADSFAKYRWCPNIIGPAGGGMVDGLLLQDYDSLRGIEKKMPIEVFISERLEFNLAEEGFISLTLRNGSDRACFFSANSVQRPKKFGMDKESSQAEFNHRLGTQLQYLMLINRLAHYIKVLQREKIGLWKERTDLEEELNRWIRQYVSDMEDPSPGVRSRRPLRQARVEVEDGDHPGWYKARVLVRPHLKYMGVLFTLSLVGKLDKQ